MKARLNKKNILLYWARNEMLKFIERIEEESHIGLIGERYSIQEYLEYDIDSLLENNSHFSIEMLKSFFQSFRLFPWEASLILKYKDLIKFSDEELFMAEVYGKDIPPECLKREIIK